MVIEHSDLSYFNHISPWTTGQKVVIGYCLKSHRTLWNSVNVKVHKKNIGEKTAKISFNNFIEQKKFHCCTLSWGSSTGLLSHKSGLEATEPCVGGKDRVRIKSRSDGKGNACVRPFKGAYWRNTNTMLNQISFCIDMCIFHHSERHLYYGILEVI